LRRRGGDEAGRHDRSAKQCCFTKSHRFLLKLRQSLRPHLTKTLASPAQCGKGHRRSFSLATDHNRASPCGSTIRKNTISAPKIIDSKCDTVAVLMFQPNRVPKGGSAWLRKIGSSTMKAAPSMLPRIEPRPPMMTMNMSWKAR